MNNTIVYAGRDLEAMSFAVNYHKWILDEFRPFLGSRVTEVGAGTGSFSELLLGENPQNLTLVEPSKMFDFLKKNISRLETKTSVNFHRGIFTELAETIAERQKPDSIVYVNVFDSLCKCIGAYRR